MNPPVPRQSVLAVDDEPFLLGLRQPLDPRFEPLRCAARADDHYERQLQRPTPAQRLGAGPRGMRREPRHHVERDAGVERTRTRAQDVDRPTPRGTPRTHHVSGASSAGSRLSLPSRPTHASFVLPVAHTAPSDSRRHSYSSTTATRPPSATRTAIAITSS